MIDTEYEQTPQVSSTTTAWLDSYAPPPPKPKKPIGKIILSVGVASLVALAVLIAMFAIDRPKACLTVADLESLTGSATNDAIDSTNNFYTTNITFPSGSADYSPSSDPSDSIDINEIFSFYKTHSDKSIVISIHSYYPKCDDDTLAKKRIDTIRALYDQAGLPAESIQLNAPIAYNPEPDSNNTDGVTTLSITSEASCKQ